MTDIENTQFKLHVFTEGAPPKMRIAIPLFKDGEYWKCMVFRQDFNRIKRRRQLNYKIRDIHFEDLKEFKSEDISYLNVNSAMLFFYNNQK